MHLLPYAFIFISCCIHTRGFLEVGVEKYLMRKASHHYANALIKVFFDQAVGAPIFNCAFFSSQVGSIDYFGH